MPANRQHSDSCCAHLSSSVLRVLGYASYLRLEDEEVYTRLDQPLADRREVVPFGNNPYPSCDNVSSFLLSFLLFLITFPFRLIPILLTFNTITMEPIVVKFGGICVLMTQSWLRLMQPGRDMKTFKCQVGRGR